MDKTKEEIKKEVDQFKAEVNHFTSAYMEKYQCSEDTATRAWVAHTHRQFVRHENRLRLERLFKKLGI